MQKTWQKTRCDGGKGSTALRSDRNGAYFSPKAGDGGFYVIAPNGRGAAFTADARFNYFGTFPMSLDADGVEDRQTVDALVGLRGRRLKRVEYCLLESDEIADSLGEAVDGWMDGVRFGWQEHSPTHFFWHVRPPDEHLRIRAESDLPADGYPHDWLFHDVTHEPKWSAVVGMRIVQIGVSVGEVGSYRTPTGEVVGTRGIWAARLGFEAGRSLVIALGELRDGTIGAAADELVVIADEATARSFRPEGRRGSAWGTLL